MTTFITIAVAGLSILAPLLYIRLLRKTRSTKAGNNTQFNRTLATGIIVWSVFIWVSGTFGWYAFDQDDAFPKFLIPLFVPVIAILALLYSKRMQRSLDSISLRQLVGFQFWRIFGAVFFLVVAEGLGPKALNGSGVGDLITGSLAILSYFLLKNKNKSAKIGVWAFMVVGIFDLMGVLYISLNNYPIWSNAVPSSALVGSVPMVFLIGIVAPIALIFHVFTFRKLMQK